MAWFLGERRGPQWKQGWVRQTMSTSTLPPLPLIAILVIVAILMSLSGYMDYKTQVRRTTIGFRLMLFLLPVTLVFVVGYMFQNGRLTVRLPRAEQGTIHRAGSSPWGVGALVVVLLLMVSYQSYFHSQWFPALWRSG